uniref:Uncharacterized protein n=1 Tax=Magallana gigas TaxID=29159 RepID=K1RHV8_MAGGI
MKTADHLSSSLPAVLKQYVPEYEPTVPVWICKIERESKKSAGLSFPAEHFIPKVQQEQQISGKEGQLRPEQQPERGQPAPRIGVFRQWAEQEETIQ